MTSICTALDAYLDPKPSPAINIKASTTKGVVEMVVYMVGKYLRIENARAPASARQVIKFLVNFDSQVAMSFAI